MTQIETIAKLSPREAALRVAGSDDAAGEWLDEFALQLDRIRAGESLQRVLQAWNLNQSEASRRFGVSRQAVSKWLDSGAPADRVEAMADLAAATDLLVHYLKRDRIPAVVRRPVPSLDGRSLVDLLAEGDTRRILATCRAMFAFERALD